MCLSACVLCLCVPQEKEKRFMLPLDGLLVRRMDDKVFSKHLFALVNPNQRYVCSTNKGANELIFSANETKPRKHLF